MPYKDEQIVIIAPGSLETLAQLGIPETMSPAHLRIRSRMFPAQQDGEWEPFKVRERKKAPALPAEGGDNPGAPAQDDEPEYFEDFTSDEGAVWPMVEGRIVNWSCFFALLTFVHKRMSPHLHSPILLVAQPCWTTSDYEKVTQFFFEKFKPPGFTIVDSALTSLWAYSVVNACVVDVGYEKTDVSAISDFSINVAGRGISVPNCGGDGFTQQLLKMLKPREFNRAMCEQLKTSAICEIPLPGTALPGSFDSPEAVPVPAPTLGSGALGEVPSVAGEDGKDDIEQDGVLDVASIVAGGNKRMEEFLARKEKEKAEKGAKKKHSDAAAAAQRAGKLRNIDKERATFVFEELKYLDSTEKSKHQNGTSADHDTEMANGEDQPPPTPVQTHSTAPTRVRKELEVGIERFLADAGGIVDRIADAIYLAISSVEDMSKRSEIWDCLIVVGNGAKIKGFREALLAALQRKYVISPSSATIFTSELPSHLTTPTGTGANTPQPQMAPPQYYGQSSGVNPLLVAAVTSQAAHLNPHSGVLPSAQMQNVHSSHGQTPTSVKYAKPGEYFPEWKDVGFDEAQFLGAQVMAKVLFVVDQGQTKGFMTRNDYNDMGPTGITEFGP